ncbi:hypothetical protein ACFPER_07120 [Agromyces aurantiacus]|uniref:DUF3592 domain-containing protein n=1 Tax=Agromyces aurantiacus TaxID=165814 RepID=A0ABV9R346_9MICO|nr:hypothetical protein [Agromyces aurantiacus]MBM7503235.1 hypothetical protein [Agromyces aurantiacus]
MGSLDVIALVAEVVAWITLAGGGLCLLAFAFARMADGTWEPTDAVVVDGAGGTRVRWFAEGEFHERVLEPDEHHHLRDDEAQPAYYRRRTPDRLRFEADSPVPRLLGLLSVILIGIGVAATVVSTVAGAAA